jgi:AcrR family transcriptional regulator
VARTQQQRREDTVARLLDASISTIIDVGYARASAAVIAGRAGLSGGALFRHFETMGDFMAATAYEVLRRQGEALSKQVAAAPASQSALEAVMISLRDITSNETNVVMYELLIAARTDEKLRDTLKNVLKEFSGRFLETARELPAADQYPDEVLAGVVALLINSFDGMAIMRTVLPQPEIEAGRIPLLMALLNQPDRSDDA